MKIVVSKLYEKYTERIKTIPINFNSFGTLIYNGRNQIKNIKTDDIVLTIKSFKKANIVNKIAYKYFRKSKAQRSYEYAERLINLGINTPINISYIEVGKYFFTNSYYICEYFPHDFSMLEVLEKKINDRENIIRQFTAFSYSLHQKGILHLDYSPGNILIRKNDNSYIFSLIDINRMKFVDVSLKMGIKNFSKLWNSEEMINIISKEYARYNNVSYKYVYNLLSKYDQEHKANVQRKHIRKTRIKSLLGKNN